MGKVLGAEFDDELVKIVEKYAEDHNMSTSKFLREASVEYLERHVEKESKKELMQTKKLATKLEQCQYLRDSMQCPEDCVTLSEEVKMCTIGQCPTWFEAFVRPTLPDPTKYKDYGEFVPSEERIAKTIKVMRDRNIPPETIAEYVKHAFADLIVVMNKETGEIVEYKVDKQGHILPDEPRARKT